MGPRCLSVALGAALVASLIPDRAFAEPPVDAGAGDGADAPPVEAPPVEAPPVEAPPVEAPPADTPPIDTPAPTPPSVTPPTPTPPSTTPPTAPTPAAAAAATSSTDDEDDEPSGALAWLGVPPMGSFQYATGVAEFGVVLGTWPGTGGFGTGFHYAERGGALAGFLLALIATEAEASSAQRRANETGRTQYYHSYSPEEFGKTGMTVDAFSSQLGGDVAGFNLDLYMMRKLKKDEELPWSIDWGINFHYLDGPDTMSAGSSGGTVYDDHDTLGLGLLIGATVPLTRWAQGEARVRPVLPIGGLSHNTWLTAELGLVGNVGNRVYVRGAFNAAINGDTGMTFGAGVRL